MEITVTVASVLAKYVFEQEVDALNKKYNIDLRMCGPGDIDPKIIPFMAKARFRNVERILDMRIASQKERGSRDN